MCKLNEATDQFTARVNKMAIDDDYETVAGSENWVIGSGVKDKSSIHRDWLMTTGPEHATKNCSVSRWRMVENTQKTGKVK